MGEQGRTPRENAMVNDFRRGVTDQIARNRHTLLSSAPPICLRATVAYGASLNNVNHAV